MIFATSGSSYDSWSITWHQWHHTAPMSRRIGLSSAFAFANASSPHAYQSTGWWAAPLRYEDISFTRRFTGAGILGSSLLELRRELLPELRDLRSDYRPAVPLPGVLREVVLVVFFSAVEGREGRDLGDERVVPEPRCANLLDHLIDRRLLPRGAVED